MTTIIQLKITLKGITPPIWRRVLVSSEMSLLELHDVIQFVFGWKDAHLFIFELDPFKFVNYPDWEEDANQFQSAEDAILKDLIPKYVPQGGKFVYLYDIGDGWQHEVVVEEIYAESKSEKIPPLCVAGERACPPENVGGAGGYHHFLQVLNDPLNGERESYLIWIGGSFDPEGFDLGSVNRHLKPYLKERRVVRISEWREGDRYFYPIPFSSSWVESMDRAGHEVAESLPFRRNIVTLLEYLNHTRVKGTDARGNFPLKHIRALSAQFINPPELDNSIGEKIYKLHSEDEVPDLMFLHVLANSSGLIYGGEGIQWVVTSLGNEFLQLEPISQIWYLTAYWFTRMNWYYLYPYSDESFVDLVNFIPLVYDVFLNMPPSEEMPVKFLVEVFDRKNPLWRTSLNNEDDFYKKFYFLWDVLLKPFDHLGVVQLVIPDEDGLGIYIDSHFILSDYGLSLIRYFSELTSP